MQQALAVLKEAASIFPYEGMPANFRGQHNLTLSPTGDSLTLSIWHHNRCWPVTITLDEFENIPLLLQSIKSDIEKLRAGS